MKISVRVKGDWFTILVNEPEKQPVRWLCEAALGKYCKLRSAELGTTVPEESFFEIRKAKGNTILDPEDLISAVLDDNDFVSLTLESDRTTMVTGNLEVHYIPEMAAKNVATSSKKPMEVGWFHNFDFNN